MSASHDPLLYNEDLAPVPAGKRTWSLWHMAALWVGMAVCVPTYTLGADLIASGMDWKQAVLTVALGNLIVLVPLVLNGHPGTKYGIPFPVLARSSFGVLGANVPALARALVACGWFGIQAWVGGWALYALAKAVHPGSLGLPQVLPEWVGLGTGPAIAFLAFWAINVWFIVKGTESIRWLETLAAPFLIAIGLALLGWAWARAGGFGPIFSQPSQFVPGGAKEGRFFEAFVPGLTAMVGYWATLSLNIPDFTRYSRSQRDQVWGQALGLPLSMTLFAFIGVAVTSATPLIFGGAPIWDPVVVVSKVGGWATVAVAMIALSVATLSTNIAANVVSPANDFSNAWPSRISFRTGGLITAAVGIVIMPWKLYADPHGYIFKWLIGYSALLGPVAGILIVDYFAVRRQQLDVPDLYRRDGRYAFTKGFNLRAIAALALGVAPSVPGFLVAIEAVPKSAVAPALNALYPYAWFLGFTVAAVVHYALSAAFPPAGLEPAVVDTRVVKGARGAGR